MPRTETTPPLPTRALHILLAEDQHVNQLLAVRMLEKQGHSVVVTNSGQEALDVLSHQSFNLMLMDMQMPIMDGFEATRAIRLREERTGQHLPIIAMTACSIEGDRERCLVAGCDEYLAKPINSHLLCKMFEEIEDSNRRRQSESAVATTTQSPLKPGSLEWDRAAALARVDGDEGFLRELAALFLKNLPTLLAQLATAVSERDSISVARAAHAIQGNTATLCATASHEQARLLEGNANAEKRGSFGEPLLELQRRLDVLVGMLDQFLAETRSDSSGDDATCGKSLGTVGLRFDIPVERHEPTQNIPN